MTRRLVLLLVSTAVVAGLSVMACAVWPRTVFTLQSLGDVRTRAVVRRSGTYFDTRGDRGRSHDCRHDESRVPA